MLASAQLSARGGAGPATSKVTFDSPVLTPRSVATVSARQERQAIGRLELDKPLLSLAGHPAPVLDDGQPSSSRLSTARSVERVFSPGEYRPLRDGQWSPQVNCHLCLALVLHVRIGWWLMTLYVHCLR